MAVAGIPLQPSPERRRCKGSSDSDNSCSTTSVEDSSVDGSEEECEPPHGPAESGLSTGLSAEFAKVNLRAESAEKCGSGSASSNTSPRILVEQKYELIANAFWFWWSISNILGSVVVTPSPLAPKGNLV